MIFDLATMKYICKLQKLKNISFLSFYKMFYHKFTFESILMGTIIFYTNIICMQLSMAIVQKEMKTTRSTFHYDHFSFDVHIQHASETCI